MKSQKIAAAVVLSVILAASGAGCSSASEEEFPMQGRYLRAGENHLILPEDGGAIVMHTEDASLFDAVETGDKIEVATCGYILESYPSSTTVYGCTLLEEGSAEDLPPSEMEILSSMGWLD